MSSAKVYDVVVVGGGPIGWAAAYEIAKEEKSVLVLEQNNFFNQAGSSNDMARMFRTMYTEDFMANLAYKSMEMWDELERDAGISLRTMSGLLNFGDKTFGGDSPEVTAEQIQKRYPFKNLPQDWVGLFAPDNGVINVPLLLRTLSRLAKDYGAEAQQHVKITSLEPRGNDELGWRAVGSKNGSKHVEFTCKKVVLTCGAYINHVLKPSFGFRFDLDIWEMVASYFSVNPGPNGSVFPSMWFQFAPEKNGRSQLFYGFPTVEWGPPNVARIAVDAANRQIRDPEERQTNVINPEDVRDIQDFIREHVVGVDWTVPAYSLTCLQTNVYDNMFVLDFVPKMYLENCEENSVVVFTAGWAMKFVPLLGKALKDMALYGKSEFALPEFSMLRKDEKKGKAIIIDSEVEVNAFGVENRAGHGQAKGSSMRV